jgi:hypothetical protein
VDARRTAQQAGVRARGDHRLALDPVHRGLYVFGGLGEAGFLNDSWR